MSVPPDPTQGSPGLPTELFPDFLAYVRSTRLDERALGNLSVAVARIMGQGRTKADGLDAPPSDYERYFELSKIALPPGEVLPAAAAADVERARGFVAATQDRLAREDARRRFANDCVQLLPEPRGYTNGYFHAGPLILVAKRNGQEWQWCVTPHYPIVSKLPPEPTYVALGHRAALDRIRELTVAHDKFGARLSLAWALARHFSTSDDVPVRSVMRMYQVAGQDDAFWQAPRRNLYKDLPEAAFVVNLLNWRRHAQDVSAFEFVPATLSQATQRDVFYMPLNQVGTEVRPMISLRKRS